MTVSRFGNWNEKHDCCEWKKKKKDEKDNLLWLMRTILRSNNNKMTGNDYETCKSQNILCHLLVIACLPKFSKQSETERRKKKTRFYFHFVQPVSFTMFFGVSRCALVSVVRNEHGETSSKPAWDCSTLLPHISIIPLPAIGKKWGRLSSSTVACQAVEEKENSEFKPVKLCLKFTLRRVLLVYI